MICDQTDRYVFICICFVFYTCKFTHFVTKGLDCIYVEDRIYILYNRGKPFQSHTSINILLL